MQKLSIRLQAVADYVTPGNCVADVGTDHGYVPIYLVERGISPLAVAMDVRPGPLERAKEHIRLKGLDAQIQTRLSDGLMQLQPGEADSVVIAGMGGLLSIRILEQSAAKLDFVKELILEPQSDIAKVRSFLRQQGFFIDKESLVLEDGKYYPVMHVIHASPESIAYEKDAMARMRPFFPEREMAQEMAGQYGLCLIFENHPILLRLLERDRKQKEKILQSVQGRIGQQQRLRDVERSREAICRLLQMMENNGGAG